MTGPPPCVNIVLTESQLEQSIINATEDFRTLLKNHDICDYEELGNGKDAGMIRPITLQKADSTQPSTISLYRTETRGERRFSISGLKMHASIDDVLTISINENDNMINVVVTPAESVVIDQDDENKIDPYPLPEFPDEVDEEDIPKIDHDQVTMANLLDGTSVYIMPRFQRCFEWNKTNFDQLWGDIDEIWFGDEDYQFLGAIVTNVHKAKKGKQGGENWVIDGQQRLTTLYALICALTKEAEKAGFEDLAEVFSAPLLVGRIGGDLKGKPTLLLTSADITQFNKMLNEIKRSLGGPKKMKLEKDFGKNTLLYNGWKNHLLKGVRIRIRDANGIVIRKKLEWLFEIVTDRLMFIMMDVPKSMSPYNVFERLNARGKPLSIADLVRNLIFGRLIHQHELATSLHKARMIPFETQFEFQKGGDNKTRLNDFYFPFALTKPIDKLTKANMFSKLRDYWSKKTAEAIIDELEVLVPVFIALDPTFAMDNIAEGDPLRDSQGIMMRINRMKRLRIPTSVYPYLMPLLENYRQTKKEEEDVCDCLDILESYLVRRNFCGLQNAGFTTLFRTMWQGGGGKPNAKHLLHEIHTKSGYDYPDDDLFEKKIRYANLYAKKALCRYVLNEWEIDGDIPDGHLDYVLDNYNDCTIEHMIPQDRKEWENDMRQWKFSDGSNLKTWLEMYQDTIPNLTILQQYENSEISNANWASKREYYLKEAKYRRIKGIVESYEKFDNTSYDECADRFCSWAIERWPFFPN